MDKRTVLFILLVTATFFGLNVFFSHSRDKHQRELVQQKEAQSAKNNAQLAADMEKRTAKPSDLPLVAITQDSEGTEVLGEGISVNGATLILAWTHKLPEEIFVKGQSQKLLTKETTTQGLALYGSEDFKKLNIASVPEIGSYDLQVVTLPDSGQPEVYFGLYRDGTLSFPAAPPKDNAIALYKTNSGYLPLGLYISVGRVFVELQNMPALVPYVKAAAAPKPSAASDQKYYVLENAYQQLVFTNVGGALAEINLPLAGKEHPQSVVNEIQFDRQIAEDYPAEAHFPGHSYYKAGSSEEQPAGQIGGFYPLLPRGTKKSSISPEYYAFNLISDYPEMAELTYEVKEFTSDKIVFEAIQPHRKITKTYALATGDSGAPYSFDLTVKVDGDSRGLFLTSGIPEVEIMSNRSAPQIQYRISRKGKGQVEKLSLPKAKEVINVSSVHPDWVVNSNGYLGVIMDPLSEIGAGYRAQYVSGSAVPTRLSVIDPQYNLYPASKYPGYEVLLPIPTQGGTLNFRFYTGPFEEKTLKAVDKAFSDPKTGYNPNYIACRTFYGWFAFISKPFAKILFVVMSSFHSLTHSWGIAIILLTIFLRIFLYPLNAWSIKSMRRMQQISPQVQAIQKKYKKEPKKGQIEIMNLYREKKVNPFMGCIPIVIQIPFLIAMFDLLKSSFQLRGASFIPGWINNLTAPDVLFEWSRPIFFIGNQFHLLPILLGGVMFIQQRFSSTAPKDPKAMTDQQRQQKSMATIMCVFFTIMFYHFPSGLNLYWLSSMSLGIGQQWLTNKVLNRKEGKD